MSSILVLLFISGIFAFIHTVSGSNEIECEVTNEQGQKDFYYLINRQSALEISQILTESLFLKNYMGTEAAKKSMHPNVKFGIETKQILDTLKEIESDYHAKGNLAGSISANDLKPLLDGYINVILKNLGNSKNGLKWIHDRVEYDRSHICSKKSERIQNPGLAKKYAALCDMSKKMIAENYTFSDNFCDKEFDKNKLKEGQMHWYNYIGIGNDKAKKSKERKKLHKKCIGLYLHHLLRYALSFVLIYRGEIENGTPQDNWAMKNDAGKGVSNTDYAHNDVAKEVEYLTFWLMTMMKQIGLSSELNGKEILKYIKKNRDGGHIHVHLKKEELQRDGPSQHHSTSEGISQGDDGQLKIQANAIGHGHHDGTASAHSEQGSDGFSLTSNSLICLNISYL